MVSIAQSLNDPELEYVVANSGDIFLDRQMKSIECSTNTPQTTAHRVTILGDAAHAMTTQRGLGRSFIHDHSSLSSIMTLFEMI